VAPSTARTQRLPEGDGLNHLLFYYLEILIRIDVLLAHVLRDDRVRHITFSELQPVRRLPFRHCNNRLIVPGGGIETNNCT
jgi:hypothetical protein